jgi:penicillin-binding protein 2
VVGYVAAVSEAELTGDPLLELPDFRIGKSGIERVYDLALRGKGGASEVEVNALGRVVKELSRRQGEPGRDVVLTLDMALQRSVGARLEGQSAAAVVMDVHTGDVLAMAASPGFDPNEFNRGLSIESWRDLLSDPRAPLINKAIAGQYAPGSTFKMVVALAALEGGVVGPGHRVLCTGEIEFGDSRFHCWKRGGHGLLAMVEAIKQSCDVYFYDLALRTGVDRIAGMARRLGLGQKLGINLPGEQPGVIPTRDWKLATLGTPWQQGETLITGIGQGFVLATPLQLAVMMARLVNGGFAVVPRLSRDPVEPGEARADPQPAFESLGVSSVALAILREAMDGVVNHPLGTAYKARIEEVGLAMGGKTGTSQVRRISKSEREKGVLKNRDRPWWERDHAVFIGYAPLEAPRYVAAVVVEHGGGGATVAAPIAHDILLEVQLRDPSRRGPASPLAGVGTAGREL